MVSALGRFSRTELLLGKSSMELLAESSVAVFGVGGVGSFAAEGLARAGVGAITLIDNDLICLTNINRQLHATMRTIGKRKTEMMRERILDINPSCKVTCIDDFYLPENAEKFFPPEGYDYVVDAVDTVAAKINLVLKCREKNIPIIASMGAGNKLDPTMFQVADIYSTKVDPIARVMRKRLKEHRVKKLKVIYSREKPIETPFSGCGSKCVCPAGSARHCDHRRSIPGSISFVPSVVGLIIAGEVVKDLTGTKAEVSA